MVSEPEAQKATSDQSEPIGIKVTGFMSEPAVEESTNNTK